MINTTRWSPDTCDCVLEYEWDTEQPEETRDHTVTTVVSACPAHAAEVDKGNHYGKVLDENQRKNNFHKIAGEAFPTELTELDEQGNTVVRGKAVQWQFNEQRALEVTIADLNPSQKTTLQTLADTQFGAGKVIIN